LIISVKGSGLVAGSPARITRYEGVVPMSGNESSTTSPKQNHSLSLDTWAVIIALALALAVRFDVLKNVPW